VAFAKAWVLDRAEQFTRFLQRQATTVGR